MPRIARKDLNACFFHVIAQGSNKEYIFDMEEYTSQVWHSQKREKVTKF